MIKFKIYKEVFDDLTFKLRGDALVQRESKINFLPTMISHVSI